MYLKMKPFLFVISCCFSTVQLLNTRFSQYEHLSSELFCLLSASLVYLLLSFVLLSLVTATTVMSDVMQPSRLQIRGNSLRKGIMDTIKRKKRIKRLRKQKEYGKR